MATQYFQVVSKTGLRIRSKPDLSDASLIKGRMLAYHDIVQVNSESRTEAQNYVWWEHTNTPGVWSASDQINPHMTLMQPYQPPYMPPPTTTPTTGTTSGGTTGGTTTGGTPPTSSPPTTGTTSGGTTGGGATSGGTTTTPDAPVLFEVTADRLAVRSQPALGNTLVSGQVLLRGNRLQFHSPTTADGFVWWQQSVHPGWWSAAGSTQGGQTFMLPVDENAEQDSNTHLLTVPWISQIQPGMINYRNDCGQTDVLMIIRYRGLGANVTLGNLYSMPYKNANGTTNNLQLSPLASAATGGKLVMKLFNNNPATLAGLEALKINIQADQPVLLLVWYPSLNFNNPENGPFNHWLVLTGFIGDTFVVNDPLWVAENQGAGRLIDINTLLKACHDTGLGLYGLV